MQFSPKALGALTEAVAHLAPSSGTLRDRLINSDRGLGRVQPIDLDASQWGDLVPVRSTTQPRTRARSIFGWKLPEIGAQRLGGVRRGDSAAPRRRAGQTPDDKLRRYSPPSP